MKERILDVASKHFTQFGYARTTLSGIAAALGKRKSALYYYFRNKEDIFQAIVRLEAENLFHALADEIKKESDEVECLKRYIVLRLRAMQLVAERYHVLKEELFFLLPEIDKAREEHHKKEVLLIRAVLERGIRKGTIRMLDPESTAPVIVNTLKGIEIPMYVKEELKMEAVELNGFLNLILFGIVEQENLNQKSKNENTINVSA